MMDNDIGCRIIELRRILGLTQKAFGEKIHISKGYITSLERALRPLNDRLVTLISDAFGVNAEWLKTGSGSMFLDPKDINEGEILSMFNQLNPDFQQFIINQLKQLLRMNHHYQPKTTGKIPPEKASRNKKTV
jgi:transcriptional regulator with XRE-family HTH domain